MKLREETEAEPESNLLACLCHKLKLFRRERLKVFKESKLRDQRQTIWCWFGSRKMSSRPLLHSSAYSSETSISVDTSSTTLLKRRKRKRKRKQEAINMKEARTTTDELPSIKFTHQLNSPSAAQARIGATCDQHLAKARLFHHHQEELSSLSQREDWKTSSEIKSWPGEQDKKSNLKLISRKMSKLVSLNVLILFPIIFLLEQNTQRCDIGRCTSATFTVRAEGKFEFKLNFLLIAP